MSSPLETAVLYARMVPMRAWAFLLGVCVIVAYSSLPVLILLAVGLFLTKPDTRTLPGDEGVSMAGLLTRVSSWIAGTEDPAQCVDALLFRVALHRDKAFLGALGQWLEIPKPVWSFLSSFAAKVDAGEDGSSATTDPTVLRISAESDARKLKERGSYAEAAQRFAALEDQSRPADPEAGDSSGNVGAQQRLAEEAGRCWTAAGKPELAIPSLQRAVAAAIDLRTKQSAAEALADAAQKAMCKRDDAGEACLDGGKTPQQVFNHALQTLYALACVEVERLSGAGRSAAALARSAAGQLVEKGRFREAGAIYSSSLALAADAVEEYDVDVDCITWTADLEECVLGLFLCFVQRDQGDTCAASLEVDAVLRRLPPLVRSTRGGFVLDVARAVEDRDVGEVEQVCFDFDRKSPGALQSWQLDALLKMKERIVESDLT
eukprot:TRINITY_DN19925_c0_g1_i4.p1 TRINITY_DN19925_c0_g1~~TRINITY_DN19925_c0_g1_i4.p1  ORF type:complete len:461 (+),score=93.20 TRINITY_DN19925_c0_g1_i4:82-1383(+)